MRISDWSSDVCSSDLNFILASLDEPSDALLLDDRAFYACAAGISLTTHRHQTVAGVLSGNGLVQPKMSGKGVFAVEAPVPVEEIDTVERSEAHKSELQSLMRISYAAFCLKKKK